MSSGISKSASQYLTAPIGRVFTANRQVKTANSRRKSILKQHLLDGLPLRYALPLSLLLVALMTWGLYHLQAVVKQHDHVPHIRPFGIGFLIPIILMTVFAKRWAGWITLFFSLVAMSFALISPVFSLRVHSARDCMELVLLTFVGGLVISGVDAMQQNRIMFADITDTAQARDILDAIRLAACAVSCVGEIRSCILRRRGFDFYVDLDFYLESGIVADGRMTLADAGQVIAAVENAVYQSHPLIFEVRARFLMPPVASLKTLIS